MIGRKRDFFDVPDGCKGQLYLDALALKDYSGGVFGDHFALGFSPVLDVNHIRPSHGTCESD